MNSGDAWFADTSVNGTSLKFLMDIGASKSVMSLRRFISIPELFQPQLYNMRMRFQVANTEITDNEERLLIATVKINSMIYTLCNLYALTKDHKLD